MAAVTGFIMIGLIWWIYYDSFPINERIKSMTNGFPMLYSHLFLAMGFVILANVIRHAILNDLNTSQQAPQQQMPQQHMQQQQMSAEEHKMMLAQRQQQMMQQQAMQQQAMQQHAMQQQAMMQKWICDMYFSRAQTS